MPLHGFSPNDFTGFQWGLPLFPYTFSIEIMFFNFFTCRGLSHAWERKKCFSRKKTVSTSPLTSHQNPSLFRHHLSEAAPENRAGHVVSACSHVWGNHKCSAIENAQKCSKKGLSERESINVGKHELRKKYIVTINICNIYIYIICIPFHSTCTGCFKWIPTMGSVLIPTVQPSRLLCFHPPAGKIHPR